MNAAHTAVSAASFQCEMMTEWARSVVKWYTVVRDMRVFLKAMTREWGPKTKRGSFFDPGSSFLYRPFFSLDSTPHGYRSYVTFSLLVII